VGVREDPSPRDSAPPDARARLRPVERDEGARVEERLKPFEAAVKLHESNIESLKRELASIK
jgi:hypothetical protein